MCKTWQGYYYLLWGLNPKELTALFWRSVMKRKELSNEELDNYYKQNITYVKAALTMILVYVAAFEHFDNPETNEVKKAYLNTMTTLEKCEKIISESNKVLIGRLHKYQKQSRCVKMTLSSFRDKTLKTLKLPFKEKAQ
jgi:hypothetical protein